MKEGAVQRLDSLIGNLKFHYSVIHISASVFTGTSKSITCEKEFAIFYYFFLSIRTNLFYLFSCDVRSCM